LPEPQSRNNKFNLTEEHPGVYTPGAQSQALRLSSLTAG
jgi:hypothetical protein